MRIGSYECYPVETGRFALDGGAMFGVVPRVMWAATNPPDSRNRIDMATRSLLLIGNGRKILIDNGNGSKWSPKLIDIYRLDTGRFDLLSSLRNYGLAPDDITDVILTHLHFDHAGGSTIRENGILKPAFPNARYYVQKAHWEQALNPTEKDRASFLPDDFLPLKEHGVLELVDGEFELFPQIFLHVMNGHTVAQQLVRVSDGKTTMLYCCDLLPMISHIPLPYIMAYDMRPLITLEEKKKILSQAVDENWILFFEHDPAVAAGYAVRTGKGYVFGNPAPIG